MTVKVAILAHVSRSHEAVAAAVRAQGVEPSIFISTHALTREPRWKYLGIYQNFTDIMRYAVAEPEDWVVILHDDVILPLGAIDKMRHVLGFATRNMVSFYNPDNQTFRTALETGHHVVDTAGNYWTQCFAFRSRAIQPILDWGDRHVIVGILAEDGFLRRYCTITGDRVQVVVPSFVQHDLSIPSTFKHAAVMGRTVRRSATYDPNFDPFAVDWSAAFAAPYRDSKRELSPLGLKDLPTPNAQ